MKQTRVFLSKPNGGQTEASGSSRGLRHALISCLATSVLFAGCAAGNFHWYAPPGSEISTTEGRSGARFTGESDYDEKRLLRSGLEQDDPLLFKIDDNIEFYTSDLLKRFESSHLLMAGGELEWVALADTLEAILIDTLVSLVADTFQLSQDSASWGDFTLVRDGLLGSRFIQEVIYSQVVVDSLEVDSFYYSRPDIFTYNAQVDLGHIVLSKVGYRAQVDSAKYLAIPDEELDSLIYRRLRFLKKEILDSTTFEEMADKYSLDRRTGDQGGRFGWVEQYNLHPEIEKVLYDEATPLYKVIGPVESRDGVHLFFLYGRYRMGIPPLNRQRYQIAHNYVLGEYAKVHYGRVRDSLRLEYPVEYNDSVLARPRKGADNTTPVAWGAGIDTVHFAEYDRARSLLRTRMPFDQVLTTDQLRSVALGIMDKRLSLLVASQLGLDNDPIYKAKVRSERQKFSRAAIYRLSSDQNYLPSDKEIEARFLKNQSDYEIVRPVRIQQIVFQDSLEAEFVLSLAESGEDFLELADKYYPGDVEIRRDAADLGYIGPHDFEFNIFSIAEKSPLGMISHPVKSQYGYHIVKVIDVKRKVALTDKRAEIIIELKRERSETVRSRWVESLLSSFDVSIEPVRYRSILMGPRENRSEIPQGILHNNISTSELK